MSYQYCFTIVTVVYNDSKNLEKTILSVIGQKFKNYQYIVIDGGSNDDTVLVLEKYKSDINIIISEKDFGIYDAMNKAINLSKGKWINFLNAGDVFEGNYFLYKLNEFIIITNTDVINVKFNINNIDYSPNVNLFYLLRNMPCHQSLFYKNSLFKNIKYDLKYKYCGDFNHLIQVYKNISIICFSDIKVKYLGGGFSANIKAHKIILKERLQIVVSSNLPFFYKICFYVINRIQLIKYTL